MTCCGAAREKRNDHNRVTAARAMLPKRFLCAHGQPSAPAPGGRHQGGGTISDRAATADGVQQTVQIFQSYGWRDATVIAEKLKGSLSEAGYNVWLDREHMRSDEQHFSLVLEDALKSSRIVVALLSPHSVRGLADEDLRSSICYNEIRVADSLELPILPVRVEKFRGLPPFLLIKYRRIDWLNWQENDAYQRGVGEIVKSIERLLDGGKNLDRDIAYQADNFSSQLATARDDFAGREWLFSRLERWLESGRKCFLIEGMTGSGKTAIVAELVRRDREGRILAYHFCSPTKGTLEPGPFVRSIAGMLANGIEAYAEQLWTGKMANELDGSDPRRMLSQGVLAPLRKLEMNGSYYIIVDALDEAMELGLSKPSLPALLAGAVEEFPNWLKLVLTTRPRGDIEALFPRPEICVLGEAAENQRMDLKAYVEKRLAEPALAAVIGEGEREHAAWLIEDRSGGSFQYAWMVLDAIGKREITLAETGDLRRELADLYYLRANQRFPEGAGYRPARTMLGVLLAAREPLALEPLAMLSGFAESAEAWPLLDALSCFVDAEAGDGAARTWRIAHNSIREWLLSNEAKVFKVNPGESRLQLLAYCRKWQENHEPYALKHVVGHLLEAGMVAEAQQAVDDGLFAARLRILNEPRFDGDDSRSLTLALVGNHDDAGIVKLARTANIAQRDGIAAGLQSAPEKDLGFIDGVVGALLKLSR